MSTNTEIEHIKCLIVGSGPAGYTAAIYASRADLHPVLYTGLEPGGQLTTTTEVDNFPGYPEGVDGPSMMVQLQQQAERFGTQVRIGMVTEVNFSKEVGGFWLGVTVDNSVKLTADTVIISTGATAKYLGVAEYKNCAVAECLLAPFVMDSFIQCSHVAIVGAGYRCRRSHLSGKYL